MVHFLATNTITLITTEIGQNVFSIVANVHSLALILMLTFSLELQEKTNRERRLGGKVGLLLAALITMEKI